MAYIPEDTEWYLAEIVMECKIEGEPRNVVHVNIILVRADSPQEAFEKAEQLGKEDKNSYLNSKNQQATWFYRGLRNLYVIHDDLEHGAELIFEEEIGIPEDKIQDMLKDKSELSVFRERQPRDSSKPDYANQEILEEVQKMMNTKED
ncbi:MAG: DUF4288 domain-containing protein [Cyanobacteriota bacterium]|nr:DUF4288 domain-containing protein [Cyanobacteriota bacterium]